MQLVRMRDLSTARNKFSRFSTAQNESQMLKNRTRTYPNRGLPAPNVLVSEYQVISGKGSITLSKIFVFYCQSKSKRKCDMRSREYNPITRESQSPIPPFPTETQMRLPISHHHYPSIQKNVRKYITLGWSMERTLNSNFGRIP